MSARNPHNLAPVPDLSPHREPGKVKQVSDEDDLQAMREGVESGLLSGSEALIIRSLRPAGRGAGRGRDR